MLLEIQPLYQVFSYLPWVKEYPNREKTILNILIFWPWENRLCKQSSSSKIGWHKPRVPSSIHQRPYTFLFLANLLKLYYCSNLHVCPCRMKNGRLIYDMIAFDYSSKHHQFHLNHSICLCLSPKMTSLVCATGNQFPICIRKTAVGVSNLHI